jgi:hypothetical protein
MWHLVVLLLLCLIHLQTNTLPADVQLSTILVQINYWIFVSSYVLSVGSL